MFPGLHLLVRSQVPWSQRKLPLGSSSCPKGFGPTPQPLLCWQPIYRPPHGGAEKARTLGERQTWHSNPHIPVSFTLPKCRRYEGPTRARSSCAAPWGGGGVWGREGEASPCSIRYGRRVTSSAPQGRMKLPDQTWNLAF